MAGSVDEEFCLSFYKRGDYWSADRRRMICEYEAPDLASVRNVQREAEAKFDRAWAADVLVGATDATRA